MKRILLVFLALPLFVNCNTSTSRSAERCDIVVLNENILAHPRLLFTTKDEARVKTLAKTDEQVAQFVERLRYDANQILLHEQITVGAENFGRLPNLLTISSEYARRFITLSMANRFFPNEKYVAKINESLIHVCNFPSWNPAHYLDVAEMTCGVALAYDWCYAELPESTRKLVVDKIKSFALELAIEQYENGDDVRSWAKRDNNWNVICNTGMTLGALATAEEHPELAERIISETIKYTPRCIEHYAPDGTCFEGAGYWNFTNIHFVMLLKALEDNISTTAGLADMPGVSKAAQFFVSTISPITDLAFNFADSGRGGAQDVPAHFYFSRAFDQPEVAEFYRDLIAPKINDRNSELKCFFFLGLAWYDDSLADDVVYKPMQIFRGINDFVVLQGDKNDSDYLYMIAKGGDPDRSHQQMDAGTFVLDKHGERWYDDMGSDNYALPGFWDYSPQGKRWNYFRNTNLSHNTITVDGKIHYSRGKSKIIAVDTLANSATIDMTSLFNGELDQINRTFKLINNQTIEILDQIKVTDSVKEIVWGGVTMTDIEIDGNRVIMRSSDKQLVTTFDCKGADVEISTRVAEPKYELEKPMDNYKFLVVRLTNLESDVTLTATIN